MTYAEFAEAWDAVLTSKPDVIAHRIKGEFDGGFEDISRTHRWMSILATCNIRSCLMDGGDVEYFARITVFSSHAAIICNWGDGPVQVNSTSAVALVEEFYRRAHEREAARDSVRRLVVSNAASGGVP